MKLTKEQRLIINNKYTDIFDVADMYSDTEDLAQELLINYLRDNYKDASDWAENNLDIAQLEDILEVN